jgi:hypothetical protein
VGQKQLKQCDHFLAVEGKLNTYLTKGEVPRRFDDLLELLLMCHTFKQYHATAAKLSVLVFAAKPELADDLDLGDRYEAARSALLAAAGRGRDPVKLTEQEKAKLRDQARTWLQADLAQWRKRLKARDLKRLPGLHVRLPDCQEDAAFATVHDPKALAHLSAVEQKDWAKLWAEVKQLGKELSANIRTERFTGALTAKIKEQVHEVKWRAGKTCLIDLESAQFDTYLKVQDASGRTLAENNDVAPGNANSQLLFTPPQDGTYRLVVTVFERRGFGAYTLTVRRFRGKE